MTHCCYESLFDRANTGRSFELFLMLFRLHRRRRGVFSWVQSATSALDATNSSETELALANADSCCCSLEHVSYSLARADTNKFISKQWFSLFLNSETVISKLSCCCLLCLLPPCCAHILHCLKSRNSSTSAANLNQNQPAKLTYKCPLLFVSACLITVLQCESGNESTGCFCLFCWCGLLRCGELHKHVQKITRV